MFPGLRFFLSLTSYFSFLWAFFGARLDFSDTGNRFSQSSQRFVAGADGPDWPSGTPGNSFFPDPEKWSKNPKNMPGDSKNLARPRILITFLKYLSASEKLGRTSKSFTKHRKPWLDLESSAPAKKCHRKRKISGLTYKISVPFPENKTR